MTGRILLVHGFGGSAEDFADWLDPLAAQGWDAAALQLPGHGDVGGPYGLEAFADFVLGCADSLGWDRFVLLGHSMGGMVAELVALRAPSRLTALILMDTAHGPIRLDPGLVEAGKHVVRTGGMAALVEAQRDMPADTAAHARLLAEKPGYREFGEAKALAMDPDMWLAMVDDMLGQVDRLDALRQLTVDTLVVVGEQDEPFLGPSRRMASAIPGARLAVIPDAGHSPQFEAPDAWWQAVSAFLEEVG